jgi:N-acetylglutamate synthase-like GNAT family acetyltransferase
VEFAIKLFESRYSNCLTEIVVVDHLKLRGLGTALVKDFINRMRALNYKIIKTHFYTKKFFEKLGFPNS